MARKSIVKRRPRHSSWPEPKERRGKRESSGLSTDERAAITAVVDRALGQAPEPPRGGLFRRRATPQPNIVELPEPEETVVLPRRRKSPAAADSDRRERVRRGQRARRLPLKAAVGTAYAGYLAWGLGEVAEHLAGPAGHVLVSGATAVTSGAVVAGMRIAVRHRIGRWSRRFWCSGIGAGAWVTAASVDGAGWGLLGVLVVGTAACSAGWLRAHEVPLTTGPALDDGAVTEDSEVGGAEAIVALWASNVACKGGAVPHSLLTNQETLPLAYRWTVQTPPGAGSFDALLNRRPRIASGIRRTTAKVQLEPFPDEDESQAVLTVVTRDILAEGVGYPGPRYRNGVVPVGPYADGTGDAEVVAYDERGVYHVMASGEPGSGKSAFLEAVCLGLRSSGEWVVLYGDGDPEGGSSPVCNEFAHWADAGPDGVLAQLEAVEAAIRVRGLIKRAMTAGPDGKPVLITDPTTQRAARKLLPCPALPGIMWQLDELYRMASDPVLAEHKFGRRLEYVSRIGRKYGVALCTASQSLLVPDYFNSTPLRGYLAGRNLFAFRNANRTEAAVVNGLRIPPYALPSGGGYSYAAGGGRLAMLRAAWSEDMAAHATGLPASGLDADTQTAMAQWWPTGEPDAEGDTLRALADLEAWRAGRLTIAPDWEVPSPSAAPVMVLNDLPPLPDALTADDVVPTRTDTLGLTPNRAAVLAALEDGATSSGDIADRTGLAGPAVSKILASLADGGLARKESHGRWTAVGEMAGRR